MDFVKIVEGCRRHEPKAQRALYDAVVQMSMGICMRYADGRDEAQDMLQDGFIKVFEGIGRLKNPDGVVAWVRNIMVNTCIDYHRTHRRFVPIEGECDTQSSFTVDPFAAEEIVAAVQQLTPMPRTVFNLCEVDGYTLDEVADRLKTSNVAVRVALSRAKKELRKILKR